MVYDGQNVGKRREYQTLISPEAYQALQEYLAFRRAAGEIITDESWVLRDKWQTTNVRRGGYHSLATFPKQLRVEGVKKCIDDALWQTGIRVTPSKQHEFKTCHGTRKYFKTNAQRTMNESDVEKLLGHSD